MNLPENLDADSPENLDAGSPDNLDSDSPENLDADSPENSVVQDLPENLGKLVPYLTERCQKNPALTKQIEKFVDRMLNECGTDSGLEHALAMFNRYRGQKPVKENQIRALSKVRNAGNIPVLNPSRRQMPITGRHSKITGRPSKDLRQDHHYNKRAAEPGWRNPPTGRQKAPQNLSHCVAMNVPLGRNCNRKM